MPQTQAKLSHLRWEQEGGNGKMKNLLMTGYDPLPIEGNTKFSSFWALNEQTREGTSSQPYSDSVDS